MGWLVLVIVKRHAFAASPVATALAAAILQAALLLLPLLLAFWLW